MEQKDLWYKGNTNLADKWEIEQELQKVVPSST